MILVSSFSHDRPKPAKVQDQKHTSQNIAKKIPQRNQDSRHIFCQFRTPLLLKKHFNILKNNASFTYFCHLTEQSDKNNNF